MSVLRFLKELYLVEFSFFYKASNKMSSHGANAAKGVAGVCLFVSIILLSIGMWIDVFLGKRFVGQLNQFEFAVGAMAFYCINYYVLVILGHGVKFEREFDNIKKSKRTFLQISCVALQLFSTAFFCYSAYFYQRFFHIIPK